LNNAQVDGLSALLDNQELWKKSEELVEFFQLIKIFGVEDYVAYNPKVIRGLDYYTGTVFEAFELGGQSRAILGGGRYDNLVADVGGNRLPGVGFAMGDVVIELVLRDAKVIPQDLGQDIQVMITVFEEDTLANSIEIAQEVREAGISTAVYPSIDKLGKQFKYADRLEIPVAIIIGPDELANNTIAVKNLKTRDQVIVKRSQLIEQIQKFLPSVP
jgi:histidyl-tRNA synthetase